MDLALAEALVSWLSMLCIWAETGRGELLVVDALLLSAMKLL
jgi:hypothetical protein